jgi:predicted transcriptional regulator YdeE
MSSSSIETTSPTFKRQTERNKWLPESGYRVVAAPTLERYGLEFNPVTWTGGLEIWIPLET